MSQLPAPVVPINPDNRGKLPGADAVPRAPELQPEAEAVSLLDTIAAGGIDGIDPTSDDYSIDEEQVGVLIEDGMVEESPGPRLRLSTYEFASRIVEALGVRDPAALDTVRDILDGAS